MSHACQQDVHRTVSRIYTGQSGTHPVKTVVSGGVAEVNSQEWEGRRGTSGRLGVGTCAGGVARVGGTACGWSLPPHVPGVGGCPLIRGERLE